MYFFETIAGLKGENLTTAVFKYLLMNSGEVRLLFVQSLIGKLSPSELPTFKNGITCETEVASGDSGRIDLLIRADNCLICVENKIWAEIQDDQPGKYVAFLENHNNMRAIRQLLLFVVLVPKERASEIKKKIDKQKIKHAVAFLYWQDIICDLQKIKSDSDSNRIVAAFLDEYLEELVGPLKIPKNKVIGDVLIANQYHYDLLSKIQNIVNDTNDFVSRKISKGKGTTSSFIGFGFDFTYQNTIYRNWLGFVTDISSVAPFKSKVSLSFSTENSSYERPPTNCELSETIFSGKTFRFKFESWPETMVEWREFLQPILDSIENAAKSSSTEPGTE